MALRDTMGALDAEQARSFQELLDRVGGLAGKPKKKRTPWQLAGAVLAVGLAVPVLVLLNAWALAWLWAWFVVPLGMPMLTMAHLLGLGSLVSSITSASSGIAGLQRDKSQEAQIRVLATTFGRPLMAVGLGYVLHWIMV